MSDDTSSSDSSRTATRSQALSSIAEIRDDLRRKRAYVDDPDLREEVNDWIAQSHQHVDADTLHGYVSTRLNDLLSDNPMYHAPHVTHGENAFPDSCEDCPHYGGACPVLKGSTEPRWRERKLEEASSEQEARDIYQQQARDTGCVQIPRFVREYESSYADFVREGDELLSRVDDAVLDGTEEVSAEL